MAAFSCVPIINFIIEFIIFLKIIILLLFYIILLLLYYNYYFIMEAFIQNVRNNLQ